MKKKLLSLLALVIIYALIYSGNVLAEESGSLLKVDCASLLDKVRITIVCDFTPSVSSYTLTNPERIIIDLLNTRKSIEQEVIEVNLSPVVKIEINQWQEQPPVTRVSIELDKRAEFKVTREIGMVVVDVETKRLRAPEPVISEPEKKISMFVKDADVVDLLRMIAMQFNLNIIITPDVKANITVRFTDIPLSSAIDALVRAADCNYITYPSGIMLIKPKGREIPGELDSRIYELDYAEATDVKEAIKRVLSARGVAEVVYRRVGDGGGSQRASAIIVTDYPEVLDRLQTVIAQLDQPSPQIAIEAKFIETSLSAEDMYGIDWSLRTALTPSIPKTNEFSIPVHVQELLFGKISLEQLSAALEILQTRGKSKLIANPRSVTLDNQTADINMGITVPLRTVRVDPETRERIFSWTEKFVPIGLKVTPHTTSDGMINMEIETKIEAITGWQGSPEDMRPVTVKREAKTQVVVKDGEVVVIGGLIKDEETKTRSKFPILGDIPILGKFLFSRTTVKHEKSELLVFIIPHIVSM